jgi:hypothetical protein
MYKTILMIMIACFVVSGCSSSSQYDLAASRAGMVSKGYDEPPTLTSSLFKSDQVVLDDEAIKKILSSKLVLPENAKIALIKFPGSQHDAFRYYGYYYWRSEDYLKTQQNYIDTVTKKLSGSKRISEVILLPSLLTPKDATIPVLREAAVRLQANLLLIYRVTSDIYHRPRMFADDQVKAYSTCEAVLLDVRTGVIPFTTVITKESQTKKEKRDMEITETMKRAESSAVLDSLNAVADKLVLFLDSTQ